MNKQEKLRDDLDVFRIKLMVKETGDSEQKVSFFYLKAIQEDTKAILEYLHSRGVVIQGTEFNAIDFAYPDVSSNTGYFKVEPLI